VGHLNDRIARLDAGGQDSSALIDQRQGLIDDISDLVPVREVARENGRVALFTPGGAILLDHRPAEIGFTPAGIIVPEMSLASGALSAVAVNGHSQAPGALDGGRLAALFAIRDTHAPAEQARLDGLARDLTERLAAPGIDPTLGPGDAALFTDAGAAFDPANEAGFAGRIALASAVDPGGAGVWRLRDGLGAAAPGNPGDASLLHALHDALSNLRTPASGGFPPEARTAAGLAADLTSNVARARLGQEAAQAFAGAEFEAIREIELRRGVDTDAELQTLLEIEKAYAANARVVATVDEMLNTLLGL
jgi:flagellar hook-associated protein 1 FlgK